MSNLLLVDAGNLLFTIGKRYPGRKVDYKKLLDQTNADKAIAYVAQSDDDNRGFVDYLTGCGYEVIVKRPTRRKAKGTVFFETNWAVEMSIDALVNLYAHEATHVYLGSSNPSLAPLTKELTDRCTVVACGIPKYFAGTHVEIDETLLKDEE